MTNFKFDNFFKKNTPEKIKFVGDVALLIGGVGVALGVFLMTIQVQPTVAYISPATVTKIANFGGQLSWWSAILCGGIKAVSKCFGVPLKDLNQ